jgi:hypothetical protein
MVNWHDCTNLEVREFWLKVEGILVGGEYTVIKELDLSLRNSWYHINDYVAELLDKGEINHKQFHYWQQKDAYDNFTQGKWVAWEKKYDWVRPHAKDPTIAIYNGRLLDLQTKDIITGLTLPLEDFRGFLFIEKSGFLEDLKLISKFGWCILAGEGFSTREMREVLKKHFSDKLIVVLHDYDLAGASIYEVFGSGSLRTEHIDLTFDNVIDIGLREVDVEEFNLPKAPESGKYLKKNPLAWRVELNALTRLYRTHNLKNPLLWYVVKRFFEEGLPLFPKPEDFLKKVERHLTTCFEYAVSSRVIKLIHQVFSIADLEDEKVNAITVTEYGSDKWADYCLDSTFDYLDSVILEVIVLELFSIGKVFPEDKTTKILRKAGISHEEISREAIEQQVAKIRGDDDE